MRHRSQDFDSRVLLVPDNKQSTVTRPRLRNRKITSGLLARLVEDASVRREIGGLGLTATRRVSPLQCMLTSPAHSVKQLKPFVKTAVLQSHKRALSGEVIRRVSPVDTIAGTPTPASPKVKWSIRERLHTAMQGLAREVSSVRQIPTGNGRQPARTIVRRHRDYISSARTQRFPVSFLKRAVFDAWRSLVN